MKKNNFYTFSEYMKENPLTVSEEDYLEMIARLCLNSSFIRVSELAQSLNVKPPSVTSMVKRLVQKGLLVHEEYGVIKLSKEGRQIGTALLDRHEAVEQFLKLIQIQDNLLKETEKIEHTLSPDTISKMKLLVCFFQRNPDCLKKFRESMLSNNENTQTHSKA